MRLMDRRCVIIGAIAAIHILVGLTLELLFQKRPWDELAAVVSFSLVACQGSILAFWATLGGKASPWRLVLATVAVVAWQSLATDMRSDVGTIVLSSIRIAQMFTVSLLLLSIRFVGLRLSCDDMGPIAPDAYKIQFSLRSMLEWTAAAAVLLGAIHYAPSDFPSGVCEFLALHPYDVLLVAGILIAIVSLWATLSKRSMGLRVGVLLATLGVCTLVGEVLKSGDFPQFGLFFSCQTILLIGSLWPVRLAGYRLIWRRRVVL